MAERVKENQFDKVGVNPFNAPVPGESLTASPATQQPWEQPGNIQSKIKLWKLYIWN